MRGLLLAALLLVPGVAWGNELIVLTSGAFKGALTALAPKLELATGQRLIIQNETAGVVEQRVRSGEVVDMVVLPPANAARLGTLLGAAVPLAKVGIGVAVKAGAAKPDISTPEGVRAAVLAARAPAWIDPAAGGSSGIYVAGLWEKWGIAGALAGKAVLVQGGLVTDALLDGRADLAFQQLSELTGVAGVAVVGPLPAAIQSYTVYAGAPARQSGQIVAVEQALAWLSGPEAAPVLRERGMEPVR